MSQQSQISHTNTAARHTLKDANLHQTCFPAQPFRAFSNWCTSWYDTKHHLAQTLYSAVSYDSHNQKQLPPSLWFRTWMYLYTLRRVLLCKELNNVTTKLPATFQITYVALNSANVRVSARCPYRLPVRHKNWMWSLLLTAPKRLRSFQTGYFNTRSQHKSQQRYESLNGTRILQFKTIYWLEHSYSLTPFFIWKTENPNSIFSAFGIQKYGISSPPPPQKKVTYAQTKTYRISIHKQAPVSPCNLTIQAWPQELMHRTEW